MVVTPGLHPVTWLVFLLFMAQLIPSSSAGVENITRKGKYLYRPSGERFYIKGVAYQESVPSAKATEESLAQGGYPEPDTFVDPLSLSDQCDSDVDQLKDLGINTLRIYSVNASLNHDHCMQVFNDNGWYVIIDLALPQNGSINRAFPTWDTSLFNLYMETASAFIKYPNVLGFNIANEVVTFDSNTDALPFVRAAARDMKAFLKAQGQERILLSYSAVDAPSGHNARRSLIARYLTCEESSSIDLFGHNSYAWVGNSSVPAAGYPALVSDLQDIPVAAYLSEFGGVPGDNPDARPWTEVAAIFQQPMTDVFSGGVAFTYFPKSPDAGGKDYSLTKKQDNDYVPRDNFRALADQFKKANGSPQPPANYKEGGRTPCPSPTQTFLASPRLPPTPSIDRCACAEQNAFSCRATSRLTDSPTLLGPAFDAVCDLTDPALNCSAVEVNGTTGTYGPWSSCGPVQRLDFVYSSFYESKSRFPGSCNFGGNATEVPNNLAKGPFARLLEQCTQQYPATNDYRPSRNSGLTINSKGDQTSVAAARYVTAPITISFHVFLSIIFIANLL